MATVRQTEVKFSIHTAYAFILFRLLVHCAISLTNTNIQCGNCACSSLQFLVTVGTEEFATNYLLAPSFVLPRHNHVIEGKMQNGVQ